MAAVLFVSDDASLMVQSLDGLEAAGLRLTWVNPREGVPAKHQAKKLPDVVVLDGDSSGINVVELGRAWKAVDPAPALAVTGGGNSERAATTLAVPYFRKPFDPTVVGPMLRRAAEVRFVGALSPGAAMRAIGGSPSGDPEQDAIVVLGGSRKVDFALVRDAMRPFADAYVTPFATELQKLRDHRALTVPETNLALTLDGARTLRTICQSGVMDPPSSLRLMWALASVGVVKISEDPSDDPAFPAARLVGRVRRRLRGRGLWVAKARSHFDILEVPPDGDHAHFHVDLASRQLAVWYAPDKAAKLDLGQLAQTVDPYWQQILKARQTLLDPATCRRYFYWLIEQGIDLRDQQAADRVARPEAESYYARGQQALAEGDAFRAVSSLAQAARLLPDEPDYEALAAWGRYMAELARGNDTKPAVIRELAAVEKSMNGRRPRPRALHAMGLLAQVAGDLEQARAHLQDAIAVDPSNQAAQRALARLTYAQQGGGKTPPPEKR